MTTVKGLSERELQLIAMSIACFETQPKVNYRELMRLSGLGTVASCTTSYCTAKKKLLALYGSDASGDGGAAAATGASGANVAGKKKKGTAPATGMKAGANEKQAATKKRGRGEKAAATTEAHNGVDENEDDDEENGRENPKKVKVEHELEHSGEQHVEVNLKDEPAGEDLNSSFIDEMMAELVGGAYGDEV